MSEVKEKTKGYVYILQVKDIDLPVCKIGMTTRSPYQRCAEINNSSTGDFIWSVAHYFAADNCKAYESLVHSKLAPLRQKGREFFNINVEDANNALISILESQPTFKQIQPNEVAIIEETNTHSTKNKKKQKYNFISIDTEYADLFQLFASTLNVKGRPFGQLNKPRFGMSDGNRGVQWNLAVHKNTGEITLGVNLEGSEKTGRWLIAPFILADSDIEKVKSKVRYPQEIFIRFSRDAWQGPSRLNIKEKYLGGREYSLSEMNQNLWRELLKEALTCLDERKNYRGRKRHQTVTLESDSRKVVKDISPHITVWTSLNLDGDMTRQFENKIAELQPVYDWMVSACQS
jgi:hypothetical protein